MSEVKPVHEMLGCFANVWIRQKHFERAGVIIPGHKHNYDHLSILASGKVEINADGVITEHEGAKFLVIRKDVVHTVKALSDDVIWYCVFANRDIYGDVFDKELNDPLEEMSPNISAGKQRTNPHAISIPVDINISEI